MRLPLDTVAGRTLLVLIIGLTVSHALSMAFYVTDRTSALALTGGQHIGERIATIDRLVANAAPEDRPRIVQLADGPKLHVTWSHESVIADGPDDGWPTGVLRDALRDHFANGERRDFRLRYADSVAPGPWSDHLREIHGDSSHHELLTVSLPQADGTWLNFAAPVEPAEPFWSVRFGLSLAVMVLAVVILSALVVRHLTKPLATFARAAQRLGVDVNAQPMAEKGPAEVRQAAHAFNEMQSRIRRFVSDRTQMIAAISHDLGTPITRLRLRAEFIEDEEQRSKMLADLDDMERMVSSALSFTRDEAPCEPRAMVDLRTLLHRVCDDLADSGQAVSLQDATAAVPYECRPVAMRRALGNLIDNAVKYGRRAEVSLRATADDIVIRIDDEGPGIPEDRHEDVFKPFHRLDVSRSRETGGAGLGLAVARSIVRAHGGDIVLVNRPEGGLRVEVRLPR